MEAEKPSSNTSIIKPRKFLPLGLVVVVLVMIAYAVWPRRITLEPPFPYGVYTRVEEEGTITWYSGLPGYPSSKTHVWRKEYHVGSQDREALKSREEIWAFLEGWLSQESWIRWEEVGSPCSMLREAEFLERGTDYRAYVREGLTNLPNASAVCVAVWPLRHTETFWVVLATRKK